MPISNKSKVFVLNTITCMSEMVTDDGFFNFTLGAYWLTGGNNRNFCRGDKQKDTWLQRQLPDRNNLGYLRHLCVCLWGWKRSDLWNSFLCAHHYKWNSRFCVLLAVSVWIQVKTELKGLKIVHAAPDEKKYTRRLEGSFMHIHTFVFICSNSGITLMSISLQQLIFDF